MKTLKFVALVCLMAIGSMAFAQKPDHAKRGERAEMAEERLEELTAELNLSQAQVNSIKAIHEKYKPQMQAIRQDGSLTRDQAKEKMQPIKKQVRDEIKAVLNPEQLKKFKEMQKEKHAERKAEKGN
jgi:predicted  nucleic acid-binding Zn-ribbon protein